MSDGRLRRVLGIFETAGISIAMMAPTAAMALNGALAATYAGAAVPLAFVLAFATIACVAFSFVAFARAYASPASVGEFNARGLGPSAGRLSGWLLLLVYALFTAGSAAEFGAFSAAAFGYVHIDVAWAPLALGCLIACAIVGTRPARIATRATLALEGCSVAVVLALAIGIVARGGARGLSFAPFSPGHAGFGGIGLATVFALLSFAGFEGAAVLGAESVEPTTTIPRALISSVALAGVLYVFVAYAQTIGFGTDARGIAAFANASSPLGALGERYAGAAAAAIISAGAAISAFAATLASAVAAARLVLGFARDRYLPHAFAHIDLASDTPARAFLATLAFGAVTVSGFALARSSGTDTFAACGTVATLALLLIYAAVQVAALRLFGTSWRAFERAIPLVAILALGATFIATIVPIPPWPAAIYPYLVVAWALIGIAVFRKRRRLA